MGIRNNLNGKLGEITIANKLGWSNLFGYSGRTLKNVYIPKEDDTTTEIDLLYITKKGIFVIESKNYIGYIFGSENQYKWTVTLYGGKGFFGNKKVEKHQFLNPIIQNKGHIKWLNKYLGKDIPMFSCIVFADCGELKSISLENDSDVIVCYRKQINAKIRKIWNCHEDVLTEDEVNDLYKELENLTNVDHATKVKHIADIKKNKQSMICPECGGKLITRTGKYGKFLGCSNYSKTGCKYIRKLNN